MSDRQPSEAGSSHGINSAPQFPAHGSPRVWFFTSALAPLSVRLIRALLAHGDCVAAGLPPSELDDDTRSVEYQELLNECQDGSKEKEGWEGRIRGIKCDGRVRGQCGAAIAEAVETFGRIDILYSSVSEAVVGTVEELSTTLATQTLIRAQFESTFFSQVNFIKSALPLFRSRQSGHIIILTGITGHIGTPGMPAYSAAVWALEGFCDSLAYEVAPFNIKMTIVQPNKEISVLTNKIVFAPQLPQYDSHVNPAPSVRDILTNVLDADPETKIRNEEKGGVVTRYPNLSAERRDRLVKETLHALTAIGGHENPPARHIVGYEGVTAVKEKLKTISEELEDFVEVSCAVDIFRSDVGAAALAGNQGRDSGSGSAP